jgi:hypothetical protein
MYLLPVYQEESSPATLLCGRSLKGEKLLRTSCANLIFSAMFLPWLLRMTMEVSSTHNHALRIQPLKGRNPQSWHGTAPPALHCVAPTPGLRKLSPPLWSWARSRASLCLPRPFDFGRNGWPDILNSQVVRQFSDSPPEIDNQRGEKKQQTYNGQDNDNKILHFILYLSATSRVGAIQLF